MDGLDSCYKVNLDSLDQERPIGVTGLLRCRNCADFLELCIESCIEGLDELIAVYHDCVDETAAILYRLKERYPTKIKVLEYHPFIYPIDLLDEQFAEVNSLPRDSVHLLSGYYNFALSKATYRYVVKIDADQIYFPFYMKSLCDAYRSEQRIRINILEILAYYLYQTCVTRYYESSLWGCRWREWFAIKMYSFYHSYIIKMIISKKAQVSLSGLNIFISGEEKMISLGDSSPRSSREEILPPFNGVGDHYFFRVAANKYFVPYAYKKAPGHNRVLEVLRNEQPVLDGGFAWFHVRAIMCDQSEMYQRLYQEKKERFMGVNDFQNKSYREIKERWNSFIHNSRSEAKFSYFYTAEKKRMIPWDGLEDIKKQYNTYVNKIKSKIMVRRDYYVEFYEQLDSYLEQFVMECKSVDENALLLGGHSIKEPLITYLFAFTSQEKDRYSLARASGQSIEMAMQRVSSYLEHFEWVCLSGVASHSLPQNHSWIEQLLPYRGWLIVYVYNARQLNYLAPLIRMMKEPILLLTEYELPEESDLPSSVVELEIEFSAENLFINEDIMRNFPHIYHYTNTFDTLVQILRPKGIVCLEGCHYQEQLLSIVSGDYGVPSVCIQQGWPSFMRTGFKRLSYQYFFTWGDEFKKCWKQWNPIPEYHSMGYMYEVKNNDFSFKRECISFFLQGPFFLSDNRYYDELLDLITVTACKFQEYTINVREHPEFKLTKTRLLQWENLSNIKVVSDERLDEVFAKSLIVISHFSSCLMEGLIHGVIPLVYDPTEDSLYFPDLNKEGFGLIAKNQQDFHNQLLYIVENKELFKSKFIKCNKKWCISTGDETLIKMSSFLSELQADIH